MISLNHLISFRKYGSIVQNGHANLIDQKLEDDGTIYYFEVPSLSSNEKIYQVVIKVFNKDQKKINGDQKCQCRCNCDSFKYHNMVTLFRCDSLFGDRPIYNKLPKKSSILSGCKHIAIAAYQLILHH